MNALDETLAMARRFRLAENAETILAALKECTLQIAQNHGRRLTAAEEEALDNARNVIAKVEGRS